MRAREALLESDLIPGDLARVFPICDQEGSDSASLDEVLELLHLGGRSLPHAVLMMIPEAWENHATMDPKRRSFYQFHASLMEPWDGPACVTFTDGTLVGAVLDRNGLRPARWWYLSDDRVVLASESGVLDVPPAEVVAKGRLQPGRMFLVDTAEGRIVDDDEIKSALAGQLPYDEWLHAGLLQLADLPEREHVVQTHESVLRRQLTFGYTEEELRILLTPMAEKGAEPIGSMGSDTPPAVLSQRSRLLYEYFKQNFAQVTNPPLDAIREEIVTSVARIMGPEQNLLEPGPASCRHILLPYPVIDNDELAKMIHVNDDGDLPGFACTVLSGLYEVDGGGEALARAIERVRREASEAIAAGARTLVLSDRDSDHRLAPIPSLLLVSAVHHHLVRTKERLRVALVVETGDAREVHHVALLLGYGAAAVNPYLAFETIEDLLAQGAITGGDPRTCRAQLRERAGQGRPEDHVEDGHLDRRRVHGGPGVRVAGPGPGPAGRVLHRHLLQTRRRRHGRARRGGRPPAPPCLPGQPDRPCAPAPGRRRRVRLPPGRRTAPVHAGNRVPAAARHARPAGSRSTAATPTRCTGSTARAACCAACSGSATPAGSPYRWTRSSRSSPFSAGSTLARCRTARSPPRHTKPLPSR